MAAIDMNKVMDTLSDATKLAANLSENVKEKKDMQHISDDSNNSVQNPNQQVQIHIGDPEGKKKEEPVVIHEKPETHIHKEFPDERALTADECDLALKKAQMENDLKVREMEYRRQKEEMDRRDRLFREEQERKDREESRIRNDKKNKIRGIVGVVLGALGLAGLGYAIYADSRDQRNIQLAPPQVPSISAEGKVE